MNEELLEEIRELWSALQAKVDQDWDRTLPFADYLVDRWEKARRLGFGEGASVYDSCLVLGQVSVGEKTWIGPNAVLDGSGGGLTIGSYCAISAGVQIYTHDNIDWVLSAGQAPVAQSPTHIGDRCYLGPHTVVSRGVTIGDGCVIGANSLVLDDIPAGSKAFGTPCRVVGPAQSSSLRKGELD